MARSVELGRLRGQRARVVDRAVRVEQPEAGEVVEAGGVALHDDGPRVRFAPDERARVGHGVGDDGCGPADVALDREVLLVQRRHVRDVRPRRAEGHRVGQAERRLQQLERQQLWLGHAVALVLLVVLHHHVAGAHQTGHRCQCVHVGHAVLYGAVDGVERVGRGDGAHDLLFARDEVAGEERRLRGVHRVAPAVRGEVVAGDGEDTGTRMGVVEVLDRRELVGGECGGLGEVVGDEVAVEDGGHVGDRRDRRRRSRSRDRPRRSAARARVSPLPSSMKRARSTSGVARSVERRARPAVVSVMNDLSHPPTRVGSSKGKGPTERTRPTKSSRRK